MVFGIASIVMLITTVWMMADDHNRPWKEYQRTFRNLDVQTTEWRAIEQQSAEYSKLLIDKEEAVGKAQQTFTVADRDQVEALLREFKLDEDAFAGLANSIQRNFPSLYDQDAANRLAGAANDLAKENDSKEKDNETVRKGRAALLKATRRQALPQIASLPRGQSHGRGEGQEGVFQSSSVAVRSGGRAERIGRSAR